MHKTCTTCLDGGPVDRPGRPPESLCSLEMARSTERSTAGSFARQRSTAGSTVRNLTVGRSTGRLTANSLLTRPPTTIFWSLFIWGSLGLFSKRFEESFWDSFSYPYQWFYPHVLEPIFSYQKESLSRVFKRDFLSFSPPIQSLFFSHILELSITISIL